jgi:hypothetical protein
VVRIGGGDCLAFLERDVTGRGLYCDDDREGKERLVESDLDDQRDDLG